MIGWNEIKIDEVAVREIFARKQRSLDKNLPVFCADLKQVAEICQVPDDSKFQNLVSKFWPGALTIVLPAINPSQPWLGDGTPNTIAVRIPNDPQILQLCQTNGPLAQTSANLSGQTPVGVPSTIISYQQGHIELIRQGPVVVNYPTL
jgi:L-threonylcarbamoyladenylate synthase